MAFFAFFAARAIISETIGKEPMVKWLHKIRAVAYLVAQKDDKPAQNTPFPCTTACRKLLICIRWEYYLSNFKPPVSTAHLLLRFLILCANNQVRDSGTPLFTILGNEGYFTV